MYSCFFFFKPGVATLAEGQNSEVSTKAIRLRPLPGHARSRGETRAGGHARWFKEISNKNGLFPHQSQEVTLNFNPGGVA